MTTLWPTRCVGCGTLGEHRVCPRCRPTSIWQIPPPDPLLRQAWTLSRYHSPYGRAVAAAKAQGDRHLALQLVAPFAEALAPLIAGAPFTAILPAPSSPWNLWRRGFSLAALAAHALACRTGHPLQLRLTQRGGQKQSKLDAAARRRNLQGRVHCTGSLDGSVLIIDDVLTTGATASACAEAALRAGATDLRFATLCAVSTPNAPPNRWTDPNEGGM